MSQETFLLSELRTTVFSGQTRTESWRRLQLGRLEALMGAHENEVLKALSKDLGKPPTEALFEVLAVRQELKLVKQQLTRWMRPRRFQVPFSLKPGEAMVKLEPLGCVLIIGPWNYPFSLIIQPLISALAAGNTAVLKPSEHAIATSQLIARLITNHFPKEIVQVVQGDEKIAQELIEQSFDHIFFTGSTSIGKKVMKAASNNLTPVTLELGGRSPAIVVKGADITTTARRLIWGKGLNAGQTCVAPNHLIVQEKIKLQLIEKMKSTISSFYGKDPINSPHLAQIINKRQFKRLCELLKIAQDRNQILFGGETNESQLRISPTLIEVDNYNHPLMTDEIFGPLLPVLSVPDLESALFEVRKQPRPLALYMFGGSIQEQQKLLETTSSGGVCFNDVVLQVGVPEMPFGGVGPSGIGRYHGIAGFEAFSHQKSIFHRPFWLDLKFRYPPYKLNIDLIKKLMG